VTKMNGYYGQQYDQEEMQNMGQAGNGSNTMSMMAQDGMSPSGMMGGQSLDDIVNQNSKEMRRRSVPVQYRSNSSNMSGDLRRLSMMEFNGTTPSALDAFQFDPSTHDGMMASQNPQNPNTNAPAALQSRRQSTNNVTLQDQFTGQASPYANLQHPGSAYQSPMHPSGSLDVGMTDSFMSPNLDMQQGFSNMNAMMQGGLTPLDMYQADQFASPMATSPMPQNMANSIQGSATQDPGGGGSATPRDPVNAAPRTSSDTIREIQRAQSFEQVRMNPSQQGTPQHTPQNQINNQVVANQTQFQSRQHQDNPQTANAASSGKFPWADPPEGWPSTMHGRPHMNSQYKNAYSSTGFDMLGVLMRVATRPNPEINIGSVDLSCAFVVCDAEMDDFPIVYCSDNFERLTGYNKHMILGRNCRFLQSPDGNVQPGIKRKYVDDDSVLYLKNMINLRKEAQISLINYRRGGQPFMNLLTMIPITWDTDSVKFFVGFQVDLVEQPNAVTNKNPGKLSNIAKHRHSLLTYSPRWIIFNQLPAEHGPPIIYTKHPRNQPCIRIRWADGAQR
jgi:PAS domain-containing protein